MSNIEKVIEEITVSNKGKTTVFEISYTDNRNEQRAYIKGTSQYYEMPVFNAGIAKAEAVSRRQVADLFDSAPSEVRL